MNRWNFLDFVDSSGGNAIEAWLFGLRMEARQEINERIRWLAVMETLHRPYVAALSGPGKGLYEIRVKYANVQYRPIACYGPNRRDITLLLGAFERGGKLDPLRACEIAQGRSELIGGIGRTCEHSFAEP